MNIMNLNHLSEPGRLLVGDKTYRIVDLPQRFGAALTRLPVVLRLLLENLVRNADG